MQSLHQVRQRLLGQVGEESERQVPARCRRPRQFGVSVTYWLNRLFQGLPHRRRKLYRHERAHDRPTFSSAIVPDMSTPSRQVAPLDVDAVRTVRIGTALWGVALAVTLLLRDRLADADHTWWIWTCVAGVVLGLIGVVITTRRRARLARPRQSWPLDDQS